MDNFLISFAGELRAEDENRVVKLSKKVPLLHKMWIKAGYDNISVKRLEFSYKSRCPKSAKGSIELSVYDSRLSDPEDREVAFVTFDVKDWVDMTWSYPVWFHYSDFSDKDTNALDMCFEIVGSNILDSFSLGSYKMRVLYKVQNHISRFRPVKNKATLIDQTMSPGAVVYDRKQKKSLKRRENLMIGESSEDLETQRDIHKEDLLNKSMRYLSSAPRVPSIK